MKQSGGEVGRIAPFADRTNDEVRRVASRPPPDVVVFLADAAAKA
jgi:hypothetical protein